MGMVGVDRLEGKTEGFWLIGMNGVGGGEEMVLVGEKERFWRGEIGNGVALQRWGAFSVQMVEENG